MNAAVQTETQTPILERIEKFMYERRHLGLTWTDEVLAEFKGEQAALVRLSLQALRKQGKLSHYMEGQRVAYSWASKQEPGAPPLRQEGTALKIASAPQSRIVAARHAVHKAMVDGKEARYFVADLMQATSLSREQVRNALDHLMSQAMVFAYGKTTGRYYTLAEEKPEDPRRELHREDVKGEPLETAPEMPSISLEESGVVPEKAWREIPIIDKPPEPTEAPRAEGARKTPRYGFFNDGTLHVDTERCKGVLERSDLEALRDFFNSVPFFGDQT